MEKQWVCLCNMVEKKEIFSALKKGAGSNLEVRQHTGAGSSCGRCINEIDEMVDAYQKDKAGGPQKKLNYGF